MVHYYYYVSAGRQCDAQTKIYKVAVGTSQQCQRDYAFLMAYAKANGHYFEVVTSRSDDFIKRLRHSLGGFNVQMGWISCRELVRELRDTISTPLKSPILVGQHRQRKALNLTYRISSNLSRKAILERR